VKSSPGLSVATDVQYEVQYNDPLSSQLDLECVHTQHELFKFVEAHPNKKKKTSESWPEGAFSKNAIVYCKDGQRLGGSSELFQGTGCVTGVALDWDGTVVYYEIQMRFSGFSEADVSGKYYFKSNCVSLEPFSASAPAPAPAPAHAPAFVPAAAPAPAPAPAPASAPAFVPAAAAAPVHVCDCYTKCKGICINAPVEGPRKRMKKLNPPVFLPQCESVTPLQGPGRLNTVSNTHTSHTLHAHFTHTSHTHVTHTSHTLHKHFTHLSHAHYTLDCDFTIFSGKVRKKSGKNNRGMKLSTTKKFQPSYFLTFTQKCYSEVITMPELLRKYKNFR
jgi:hypothetical protein